MEGKQSRQMRAYIGNKTLGFIRKERRGRRVDNIESEAGMKARSAGRR